MPGFAVAQSSPMNTPPPVTGYAQQPSALASWWAQPGNEVSGLGFLTVVAALAGLVLWRRLRLAARIARRLADDPRA